MVASPAMSLCVTSAAISASVANAAISVSDANVAMSVARTAMSAARVDMFETCVATVVGSLLVVAVVVSDTEMASVTVAVAFAVSATGTPPSVSSGTTDVLHRGQLGCPTSH